ncbi:MAG TPA: sugar transferase [Candidatus Limnocylindrales bacterium]|nr:sugar transferase [Candidatus Limnocylindrales bacterium]
MTERAFDLTTPLAVPETRLHTEDAARVALRKARQVAIVLLAVAATTGTLTPSGGTILMIALATGVWAVALHAPGHTPDRSTLALGTTVTTACRTLTGLAVLSMLVVLTPPLDVGPGHLVLMAAAVFAASRLVGSLIPPSRARRRRLLLVGSDESVRDVLAELEQDSGLPFDVVGIVDDEPRARVDGVPVLGGIGDLSEIVRGTHSDLIVLGADAPRSEALSRVFDLATLDVRVVDVHHFSEHAFGKVSVENLSPEWFMGVLHLYQRPYSRFAKRAFDVVVASVALVLAAPVMAAVCVAVRLSGPGPIFFRQLRLGEGGKPFEVCKFRTMIQAAEQSGVAVWAGKDDARVTRVGSVLRRTRLDELPQFWNVLKGEMSTVGPRPERPEFLDLLTAGVPYWTRRNLVKPGITGWAQIRQGYTADVSGAAEKLAYDLYYLKYRSLLFDFAIVSRTVTTVLTGFGSR